MHKTKKIVNETDNNREFSVAYIKEILKKKRKNKSESLEGKNWKNRRKRQYKKTSREERRLKWRRISRFG